MKTNLNKKLERKIKEYKEYKKFENTICPVKQKIKFAAAVYNTCAVLREIKRLNNKIYNK